MTGPVVSRRAGSLVGVALLCAGLMAGCSTTSTTRVQSTDAEVSAPPKAADPAKRARARMELASAYFAQGQSDTALGEVKLALEADPKSADAYNLSGLIYASLSDPEQADSSFRRALELNPRDGSALHNYGWFQCQQGRYTEAKASFVRALAVPQYRDTTRTMLVQGVCLARSGSLVEADETLSRLFEIEPGNPAVAVNLAEVLYRRGLYERARFYIRRVNNQPEQVNPQTLWLGVRIERRAGNPTLMAELANQLRSRFPTSREAAALDKGQFDE